MATATMGQSSVDRLARSKRPTVERAEIHIPPAPVFPLEAVTGDPARRARAVASFNNALQKWRNDAWSIEAPFVPDAELQADVAKLEDTTAKTVTTLNRAVIDIRHVQENITNIDNSITTIDNQITVIEDNAITGTGIVQANGSNPPTAIMGTDGHVPYWLSTGPTRLSLTSPIYTDGTRVGIGTDLPAGALLDIGLAGVTAGTVRLAGSSSGNVIIKTAAAAGTWTLTLPVDDGNTGNMLITDGNGVTSWISPTTVVPAALTRVDDTNVTLTLGGSPTVALLAATSLTLGWTGVLSIARGGTNASSFAVSEGVVYFDGTRLINVADLIYSGSELISRGISLNGINEPYLARNINTGSNSGTGYEAELADTSNNLITAGYITWFKEQSWTTTATTQDSSATIGTTLDGATIAALLLRASGSVVCGKDATATTRTTDFLYIPSSAGNPTGVAEEFGSRCAMVFDTTNNRIFVRNPTDDTWRSVAVA